MSSYETRSKKSLCDIPIEQLEAPLFDIRPDFEFDLTPLQENDEDYINFLSTALAGSSGVNRENQGEKDDDDSDDPDYNFLDDKEIVDGYEWRLDKTTKVSKQELHGLLSDLLVTDDEDENSFDRTLVETRENPSISAAQIIFDTGQTSDEIPPPFQKIKEGEELLVIINNNTNKKNCNSNVKNEVQPESKEENIVKHLFRGDESTDYSATLIYDETLGEMPSFTSDEEEQLKQQMRQHVQLLAQTFLLSNCSPDLTIEKAASVQKLNDIQENLSMSKGGENSFFNVYNLPLALQLVNRNWNVSYKQNDTIFAINKTTKNLPKELRRTILNSKCFLYPTLLPKCRPFSGLDLGEKKRLPSFCAAEDLVLALAYLQFWKETSRNDGKPDMTVFRLIQTYCLPIRSSDTIRNRFYKLMKTDAGNNVLQSVSCEQQYPDIVREVFPFDPLKVVEPELWPSSDKPRWMRQVSTSLCYEVKKRDVIMEFTPQIISKPMNGFLTDDFGNVFPIRYDHHATPSLKFQLPPQLPLPETPIPPTPTPTTCVTPPDQNCNNEIFFVPDPPPTVRSPSPFYVNIGTPPSSPSPVDDVTETNNTTPVNQENKHKTTTSKPKRIRTQRVDNVLKAILSVDEHLEDACNEVLAFLFFKSLKGGLFMHQSQLHRFCDTAVAGSGDVQTFETLMRILSEEPTPHKHLCDFMAAFLRSDQALRLGCLRFYRNQRTALNVLRKLERYGGTQKHKNALKTFFRRLKNDDVEWTMEKFYDELRQIVGTESPALWDQFKPLFDHEIVDAKNYDAENFEVVDEVAMREPGADEFENVTFDANVDQDYVVGNGQRTCPCVCHNKTDVATNLVHCTYCKIKFCDGKIYVCRSGRFFVPGVLDRGSTVIFPSSVFSDNVQTADKSIVGVDENVVETPLNDIILEQNENIRRFLSLVDAVENVTTTNEEIYENNNNTNYCFSSPSRKRRKIDDEDSSNFSCSIFLRGSQSRHVMLERADELRSTENSVICSNNDDDDRSLTTTSTLFADIWTENVDRCLLEQLNLTGVFDDACRSAAKKLRLEYCLVKNRMQFLIECLENDNG